MKRPVLKLAMIGAGKMAFWHLRAYARLENIRVVAICNPTSAQGHQLARRYRIPRHYRDYEELLKSEELDAVDLCIPTGLHASFIIRALEKGLHVYTEKPMCRTPEEAREIIRANLLAKKIIFNGFNLRTWRPIRHLTSVIRSGRLGEVRFVRLIRTTYEFPGSFMENPELNSGIINEFTGHFIDLLQGWGWGTPETITTVGNCLLGAYGDPDTVSVQFNYAHGPAALMHNSLGIPGITPEIVVAGTQATARLIEGKVFVEPVPTAPSLFGSVFREFRHALVPPWRILSNPFRGSTQYFSQCIFDGVDNLQDEYSAQETIFLADLAQRSWRERKSIEVEGRDQGEED